MEIPKNEILVGDAKEKLEELPDNSIDTAMTSPPYWALRDYGKEDQLGLEDTPEQYVENLMEVFNELKRVLKPTGTFYLNIDDTYSRGSRPKDATEDNLRNDDSKAGEPDKKVEYDLPDKSMSMIPERVIMAMVDNGWILRNKIVWRKKGGGMPESVKDRFSTTWEYVYMFSLNQDYYFDLDAVREPHSESSKKRLSQNKGNPNFNPVTEDRNIDGEESLNVDDLCHPEGKNPGDMWTIATAQMSEAHFAVYPTELCEKPVKAGCPKKVCAECGKPYERVTEEIVKDFEDLSEEKKKAVKRAGSNKGKYSGQGKVDGSGMAETPSDSKRNMLNSMMKERKTTGFEKQCSCEDDRTEKGVILDPFAGAGTTCLAARQYNRNYIGIELNEEYAELARNRIKDEIGGVSLDNFVKSEQKTITDENL